MQKERTDRHNECYYLNDESFDQPPSQNLDCIIAESRIGVDFLVPTPGKKLTFNALFRNPGADSVLLPPCHLHIPKTNPRKAYVCKLTVRHRAFQWS